MQFAAGVGKLELTRFGRRWLVEKGRGDFPNAANTSTICAGVPATDRRAGAKGRSIDELAREFEPSANAIREWVKQAGLDEGLRSDGLKTAEQEELNRLRRENRVLREEREILAKAAAWFATKPVRCRHGVPIRERESDTVLSLKLFIVESRRWFGG